ncbi:MAG: ATP-binding protein [Clostridia bacterium]
MRNLDNLKKDYDNFINSGCKYLDNSNFNDAIIAFTNALKCLIDIADNTTGEVQQNAKQQAIKLLADIDKIKLKLEERKQKELKERENEQKQSNDMPKIKEEEDTSTVFKSATIPTLSFDDVAGLENVKSSVKNRIILPLEFPEIYKMYNKQIGGGILMYGLPGTGKTMIAKAIAHEVGANYYEVLCSDIVSKWFGEAEKNIKNLFDTARANKRAVIFFDEFEAIGVKRGGNSTVMNRIVPELLAQMQGFKTSDSLLLVVAATNRPWDIDSALLRPGRFNELLYIPLPDYDARLFMVEKALNGIPFEGITAQEIAKNCEGFNGADIVEFCERLKLKSLEKAIAKKSSIIIPITLQDYLEVANTAKSSVSAEDIKNLEKFEANRN